jgi:hypothetical protein
MLGVFNGNSLCISRLFRGFRAVDNAGLDRVPLYKGIEFRPRKAPGAAIELRIGYPLVQAGIPQGPRLHAQILASLGEVKEFFLHLLARTASDGQNAEKR